MKAKKPSTPPADHVSITLNRPRHAMYLARDALTEAIIMRERLPAHPDHAPALRAIIHGYLDQADAGIRAVRAELAEEEQQGEEDQS